jgi:hypothetical protein
VPEKPDCARSGDSIFALLAGQKHHLPILKVQRTAAVRERLDSSVRLGLGTKPGLGVANERPQLGEKLACRSVVAVELLDALEPPEH